MKQTSAKQWLRLLTGLFLVLCLMTTVTGRVAARSVKFTALEIEAEILADGTLDITERRTAQFDGAFSGMYQWINREPGVSIVNMQVGDETGPYRFRPGATTYGPAGTYYVVDESRRFYVDWSYEAANETRTFILNYQVLGQVKVHQDVAELYYQWVGDQWDISTNNVKVTLTLPAGASQDELRAWGHGPLTGKVSIDGPRQITWTLDDLPARTFLEGRVTFPTRLITGEQAQYTNTAALDRILAEEGEWARQANQRRLLSKGGLAVGVVSPIIAIWWSIRAWRLGGRPHPTRWQGDYYRELPATYGPAELAVLWRFGDPNTDDFSATILDLARRGYLRIEEAISEKKGLFRTTTDTEYFLVRQLKEGPPLRQYEADALKFIFETVGQGKERVAFDNIRTYATTNTKSFHSFWQGWIGLVRFEADAHNFFDDGPEIRKARRRLWLGTFVALVLIVPAAFVFPLACIGLVFAAVLQFIVAVSMNRRSASGQEDYVRWQAFERFLRHFSQLDRHTIPSLVIWEHYLVYAVTLGVAKEVLSQLELVYPNLTEGNYHFGYGWYYWPVGRGQSPLGLANSFNTLSNTISQSLRIATMLSLIHI